MVNYSCDSTAGSTQDLCWYSQRWGWRTGPRVLHFENNPKRQLLRGHSLCTWNGLVDSTLLQTQSPVHVQSKPQLYDLLRFHVHRSWCCITLKKNPKYQKAALCWHTHLAQNLGKQGSPLILRSQFTHTLPFNLVSKFPFSKPQLLSRVIFRPI